MRQGTNYPTPPLARQTSGAGRIRELLTGVGRAAITAVPAMPHPPFGCSRILIAPSCFF